MKRDQGLWLKPVKMLRIMGCIQSMASELLIRVTTSTKKNIQVSGECMSLPWSEMVRTGKEISEAVANGKKSTYLPCNGPKSMHEVD